MKSNKIYKLLVIIVIIIFTLTLCSTCYADTKKITKDVELNSCSSINNVIIYGGMIETDDEFKSLSIDAKKFNLPSNLYDYKDDIRVRVTYSEEDYKVYDCKVINYKTGKIIEDLSEENINKLFSIDYGKKIIEKSWSDKIKLSEINENTIYKYTASSTIQFPEIENDIGKNCIIYIKEKNDTNYKNEINMFKKISFLGVNISFNEYESGDTFCIMYKSLENSELLDFIEKDKIIYLSKFKDGDKLEYQFEKYIYNDTDKNITVNTKDVYFGVEMSDSIVIGKNEIYGFDWMIDEASISYTKDTDYKNTNNQNNKTEQNQENIDNNKKTENNKIEQNQENIDNNKKIENNIIEQKQENINNNKKTENNEDSSTLSSSKLPKAGTSNSIIIMILILASITVMIGIKLRKFKDIK